MSEPAWAQPARSFVPSHLQPGSTRSSFAKPEMLQRPNASTSAPQAASLSPAKHRSGFASRQKSRSKRMSASEAVAEDELPPTLSIRSVPSQSFDADPDMSINSFGAGSARKTKPKATTPGVTVTVFGFPPGSAADVLQYFGKLGEIIENTSPTDVFGDKPGDWSNSVECGRNWLRLTYKDRQSAVAALGQNGHIMPGQYVIGCVLADASEQKTGIAQSSTNSLLLDDSELSFVHERSLASADVTNDNNQGSEKPNEESSLNVGKIIPVELSSHNTLFREPVPKKEMPKVAEFTSTPVPKTPETQSTFGRVLGKLTDLLFGWDL